MRRCNAAESKARKSWVFLDGYLGGAGRGAGGVEKVDFSHVCDPVPIVPKAIRSRTHNLFQGLGFSAWPRVFAYEFSVNIFSAFLRACVFVLTGQRLGVSC